MLVWLSRCISPSDGACSVRLNEINTDDVGRTEFFEFIELVTVCDTENEPKPSLRDYILLGLKEFHPAFKGPSIVMSVDLYHQKFKSDRTYFVVASPNKDFQSKIDLPFNAPSVMFYRKKQIQGQTGLQSFFKKTEAPAPLTDVIDNGNQSPMAILLLKDDSQNRDTCTGICKLRLAQRDAVSKRQKIVPHMKIDLEAELLIMDHVVDMIIYSRRSVFNSCKFFEKVIGKSFPILPQDYELRMQPREWDKLGHEDLSVNRCPRTPDDLTKPFLFTHWKLGARSPGEANDCRGTRWIIEENLGDILMEEGINIQNIPQNPPINVPEQCGASTLVSAILKADSEKVVSNRDIQQAKARNADTGVCSNSADAKATLRLDNICDDLKDLVRTMQELAKASSEEPPIKKVCQQGETDQTVRPWEDTSHFPSSYDRLIQQHQRDIFKQSWLTNARKSWMNYIFNSNDPTKSTFQCRFCEQYVREHHIQQNVPEIAKSTGYLAGNWAKMKDIIMHHPASGTHKAAIKEVKEKYANRMGECVKEWKKQEESRATTAESVTSRRALCFFFWKKRFCEIWGLLTSYRPLSQP